MRVPETLSSIRSSESLGKKAYFVLNIKLGLPAFPLGIVPLYKVLILIH